MGTKLPVYKTTGHVSTNLAPLTVIKSGSPGPAPIKNTVMTLSPQYVMFYLGFVLDESDHLQGDIYYRNHEELQSNLDSESY